MLANEDDVRPLLRCPCSGEPLLWRDDGLRCASGGHHYRLADGIPVLIDYDNSVLDQDPTESKMTNSPERKHRTGLFAFVKRLLSPAKDTTRDNVAEFRAQIKKRGGNPIVLMIGAGTVGQGMDPLYDDPEIRLVSFDIYRSSFVHFVADAHAIPLADGSVDGAVIQAVLEHVLHPTKVVNEIWRVLRPGGVVYAETPFLQHVHEGPYDFTRFTESGHRHLFRRFALLRSGASGGPGTQLLWSIDYFFRSLFRSVAIGKVAKLAFFWVRYFDRLIPARYASDAASGTFFLGTKSTTTITPHEAITFYRGAQR